MNTSKVVLLGWLFVTIGAFPIMLWAWFDPSSEMFGPVAVALTFLVWGNLLLAVSTFDTMQNQRRRAAGVLAQQQARQAARPRRKR